MSLKILGGRREHMKGGGFQIWVQDGQDPREIQGSYGRSLWKGIIKVSKCVQKRLETESDKWP